MITPEKDCENLRNSLSIKNINNIINIISKRTYGQRKIIIETFKKIYNKDLIQEINKIIIINENLKECISFLFLDKIEYDCISLNSSFSSINKDLNTIIEIISTRNSSELKQIMKKYTEIYKNKDLIKDIESSFKGINKNILVTFLKKEKNENQVPNIEECQEIAKKLKLYFSSNLDNNDSILYQIIANNSSIEIEFISKFYRNMNGYSISQEINKIKLDEDIKYYLNQIILARKSSKEYFAHKLYEAINNKNEKNIVRIIITRHEVDLEQIKQCYFQLYNKILFNDLKNIFTEDILNLISNLVVI